MEKIFNWISIVAGLVGGIIANALGGFDGIMIALIRQSIRKSCQARSDSKGLPKRYSFS